MFTAAAHKNLMPDQPASGKIAWRLLVKAVVCIVRIYNPKGATDQGFLPGFSLYDFVCLARHAVENFCHVGAV